MGKDEVLPLNYYKPFKASKLFVEHHYPDWDLSDYQDKFWHSERLFNAIREDELYESNSAYKNFRAFLTAHCFVYPVPFVTYNNLFTLHFVWHE